MAGAIICSYCKTHIAVHSWYKGEKMEQRIDYCTWCGPLGDGGCFEQLGPQQYCSNKPCSQHPKLLQGDVTAASGSFCSQHIPAIWKA